MVPGIRIASVPRIPKCQASIVAASHMVLGFMMTRHFRQGVSIWKQFEALEQEIIYQ